MNQTALTDFGARYAAAWSGQNPVSLASFYSENGTLTVNGGAPSVGRTAITETAVGFMTAFPDMVVTMDHISQDGCHTIFRWTWTGTNTGPEALPSPFESTATKNGRLAPMVSLRSRRVTSMKRSTNAS